MGIVENPRKLSDEFALVSPSSASADRVDVLVNADAGPRSSDSFFQSLGDRSRSAFAGSMTRGNDVSGAAETLAIFSVATVFLLLASLVAAAGFAVVAQRRLRQLGMLAAIGATEKHRRLVLLANGAVVGTVAAFVGTIAGLALWVVFAPTLESAVDHRIHRLSLPWAPIAMAVVLSVVGATVAAWWPGRTVARLPVLLALSGRPPQPRPARHSAIAAASLIAVGVVCLALSDRDSPPLIIAGLVATILGTLLIGPLAIRVFALAAGRAPIAARLALRDLARYQARSGAALAAITLALGIAAAVVITAAAAEKQEDDRAAAGLPNLSDRQIRVYTGPTQRPELIPLPIQTPVQLARSAARVGQLAAVLAPATVIPLRKALQSGEPPIVEDGERALVTVGLARQVEPKRWTLGSGLYVATPALLRHLGIDPATIDPSADFLADQTVPTDELVILDIRARKQLAVTNVQRIDSREVLGSGGEVGGLPASFVTLGGLRRHGWTQIPSGWLVESSQPLTSEQIAAARALAAEAGLAIETQRDSTSLATPIAIATAAGAFLALAILAMTIGLIRSESASDLRTLTATGATGQDPPYADGGYRWRTGSPRRTSRRRRRLSRAGRDVPRRPRVPRSDPRPFTPRDRPRRSADRRDRRLAPSGPRASRHRQARHRMIRPRYPHHWAGNTGAADGLEARTTGGMPGYVPPTTTEPSPESGNARNGKYLRRLSRVSPPPRAPAPRSAGSRVRGSRS